MPAERMIAAPEDVVMMDVEMTPDPAESARMIDLENDIDVDDVEPMPLLTLQEAKQYMERIYEFVVVNKDQVQEAGCSNFHDLMRDAGALNEAISCMRVTSRSQQSSLLRWMR